MGPNQTISNYQLGDCIGKGAFGSVYRALNWETGEVVAVKQVKINNIPKSELNFIMTEIDLLKNLNHQNIVQYKGRHKETEYLYIILEYCENGSLHNICKKFGKFPENLVAIYISQVLEGLLYLHDQGVIHRDIKGANILTTKEVGSPYWMAPEIIELSGATTSSDIWSVGCVVIELIEGQPPYYNLDPMPALFRIVQDEHPPLPESASPVVKDFLMQCFQKDGNLRISAKKLLKHPWIANIRKKATDSVPQQEAIKSVQEWNEALKYKHRRRRSESIKPTAPLPLNMSKRFQQQTQLFNDNYTNSSSSLQIKKNKGDNLIGFVPNIVNNSSVSQQNRLSFATVEPDNETDNWDDDFDESIISKIAAHQIKQTNHKEIEEDNTQTIRPEQFQIIQNEVKKKIPTRENSVKTNGKEKIINDTDSNTVIKLKPESKLRVIKSKVSTSNMTDTIIAPKNLPKQPISNLEDISKSQALLLDGTIMLPENSVHESSRASFDDSTSKNVKGVISAQEEIANIAIQDSITPPKMVVVTPPPEKSSFTQQQALDLNVQNEFNQYRESEDDDYDDVFASTDDQDEDGENHTLKLNTRLSNNSWLGDDFSDEDDPFSEMEERFDETDMDANIARDKYAQACSRLEELISALQPNESENRLISICVQLIDLLMERKELKNHFIMLHGVIPIIDILEICSYTNVLSKLLKIVNIIIEDNITLQENLCLVGGIPIIMNFTSRRYNYDIRLEAANFIRQICHTSLQIFISCRGLKVLVELLQEDYTKHKQLIWIAVNGIWSVFELQSPTPKNDFCRLLSKYGLLDPLSITLHNVIADPDPSAPCYVDKIVNILLLFSQADAHIKEIMATRTRVVPRIFEDLDKLSPILTVVMLKCIKNLSMNSNTLEALQNAGTIKVLTGILDVQAPPYVTEISNQVLNTMFNLCRINKSRQKTAANAGIVPHLKYFAYNKSPLKQFALPILCEMPHAGGDCRDLLWKHDILQLYLDLMTDPFWQVNAIEAILVWLQEETEKVEPILLQPKNIELILEAFITAKANSFENILEPLHLITQLSQSVTCALAQQNFFKRLLHRLGHPKPVVRLNLLKILKSVCDVHPQREAVVEQYGLYNIIEQMSKEDPAVLIKELAKEIISQGYFIPKEEISSQLFSSSPSYINGEIEGNDELTLNKKGEELEGFKTFDFEKTSVSRERLSSYQTRPLSSPKSDYPLSTSYTTLVHPVPTTLSASNYTRSTSIASSSSHHHHPASSTIPSNVASLSLTMLKSGKKLQAPIGISTPSTSTPLTTSESSLSFPYQCIRKRDSIRKMRTLLHNHSFNKQISRILESTDTISKNSILNSSDNNSLEACSCQGCILGILKKRVANGNEKVKKVMKRVRKRTIGRFSKIQKSVNNKDAII
ncbi:cytokinesis protein sepH [Rhizophagus clarus]|uniref:non-specific serine/threonine protein kinase n=1 Tax=Rhizophagus clarus TaxID=94130 RepID=A0A8H3R155_9GLOM|nr:cytokinesis protein sepH [Rhizophagus clarus]